MSNLLKLQDWAKMKKITVGHHKYIHQYFMKFVVFVGPVGSGKTRNALALVQHWAQQQKVCQVVLPAIIIEGHVQNYTSMLANIPAYSCNYDVPDIVALTQQHWAHKVCPEFKQHVFQAITKLALSVPGHIIVDNCNIRDADLEFFVATFLRNAGDYHVCEIVQHVIPVMQDGVDAVQLRITTMRHISQYFVAHRDADTCVYNLLPFCQARSVRKARGDAVGVVGGFVGRQADDLGIVALVNYINKNLPSVRICVRINTILGLCAEKLQSLYFIQNAAPDFWQCKLQTMTCDIESRVLQKIKPQFDLQFRAITNISEIAHN